VKTSRLFLISILSFVPAFAQKNAPFVAMGDSLTEGDQSYVASTETQSHVYANLVAIQMGVPFQQPLITTNATGLAGSTSGRSRINPSSVPDDIGVSGANTATLLAEVATSGGTREADLVLPPTYGSSQMSIVQSAKPKIIFCWIGNNDLIGYVLNFTHLNDPTVTPLSTFTTEYQELIADLKATGAKVVVGNIPDLTKIGFLFDNNDLIKYTGTNYNLAAGYYTTFPTMALLKLGVYDASYLQNPDYVLSPAQITNIQQQVVLYNQVIANAAAGAGFGLADIYTEVNNIINDPITLEGFTVSTHYNGGAFSLDGVHPSDSGYALFANTFINAYDATYDESVPPIPTANLTDILNSDPYIDWDGSGVVAGRPGNGLLETFGPIIGVSGDKNQGPPTGSVQKGAVIPAAKRQANVYQLMREYRRLTGGDPNASFAANDVVQVFKNIFQVH
jgi:lysophospholipase L1-like esterase